MIMPRDPPIEYSPLANVAVERDINAKINVCICRWKCVYDVLVCGCYIIKKLRDDGGGGHEPLDVIYLR